MTRLIFILLALFSLSCQNSPEKIEGKKLNPTTEQPSDKAQNNPREIETLEVLQTDKYTYLRTEQDGEEVWVATSKFNANVGDQFVFTQGLLKKNFYSKEFDRVFETLYLVSQLKRSGEQSGSALERAMSESRNPSSINQQKVEPTEGVTSLDALFADPKKFQDKKIKVKGQAVKVNYNIMNRNWIHIRDGLQEGDLLDLTITTDEMVHLGHVLTFEGIVGLNRDFGSGYRYEIILEQAKIVDQ